MRGSTLGLTIFCIVIVFVSQQHLPLRQHTIGLRQRAPDLRNTHSEGAVEHKTVPHIITNKEEGERNATLQAA